jgi:hypothetical protein
MCITSNIVALVHHNDNLKVKSFLCLMALTFLALFIHHTTFVSYKIHFYHIYSFTKEFRRKFETPILRGQDAMATQEERQKGQACLDELAAIVNRCLIRRTSALLSKYLPVKIEQVICIRLTDVQQRIYSKFLASDAVRKTVQGKMSVTKVVLIHLWYKMLAWSHIMD